MSYRHLALPLSLLAVLSLIGIPAVVSAEPCLVVYPAGPTVYHFDANEYYTVGFGDAGYSPTYDRGGKVLLTLGTHAIPLDIYQTPNLTGFVPSVNGKEGYFFIGSTLDLVVDGWSNRPVIYRNILLVFEPDPKTCHPSMTVGGSPFSGKTYPIGDLVVSTPTVNGKNYSDTLVEQITWSGCYGVRIWAFADENYNGVKDGGECFTAFSHDVTVPTQSKSWGEIKSIYE